MKFFWDGFALAFVIADFILLAECLRLSYSGNVDFVLLMVSFCAGVIVGLGCGIYRAIKWRRDEIGRALG